MKKFLTIFSLIFILCLFCGSALAVTEEEVMSNINAPNDPNLQVEVNKGFLASLMSLMSLVSDKTRYGLGEIISLDYRGNAIDASCNEAGVTIQIYKGGSLISKNNVDIGKVSANQQVVAGWKLPTSGDSRFSEGAYESVGVIYCSSSKSECISENCGGFINEKIFSCERAPLCELLISGTHNWAVCKDGTKCSGYGLDSVPFTIGGAPECIDGYGTKCQDNSCGLGYKKCSEGRWLSGCYDKNTGELISNLLKETNHCADNKDNDCDGLIDCKDNDCTSVGDCKPIVKDRCVDSTPKGSCSNAQPLYCNLDGSLSNDCVNCDCPQGDTCNPDTKQCISTITCELTSDYKDVGCGGYGCKAVEMSQRATVSKPGCDGDFSSCPDGTDACKCTSSDFCKSDESDDSSTDEDKCSDYEDDKSSCVNDEKCFWVANPPREDYKLLSTDYCWSKDEIEPIEDSQLKKSSSTELENSLCYFKEQCIKGDFSYVNCLNVDSVEEKYQVDIPESIWEGWVMSDVGVCVGHKEPEYCSWPLGCFSIGDYDIPLLAILAVLFILLILSRRSSQ